MGHVRYCTPAPHFLWSASIAWRFRRGKLMQSCGGPPTRARLSAIATTTVVLRYQEFRSAWRAPRRQARRVKAIIPRADDTAGGLSTSSRAADEPVRERRRAGGAAWLERADAFIRRASRAGSFPPKQASIPACQGPDRASRTAHQRGPMICVIRPAAIAGHPSKSLMSLSNYWGMV